MSDSYSKAWHESWGQTRCIATAVIKAEAADREAMKDKAMTDAREKAIEAVARALHQTASTISCSVTPWDDLLENSRRDFIRAAEASVQAYEAAIWQPIETADKNGSPILVKLADGSVEKARYDDNRHTNKPRPFWNYDLDRPSRCRENPAVRWRPLPAPPSSENGE